MVRSGAGVTPGRARSRRISPFTGRTGRWGHSCAEFDPAASTTWSVVSSPRSVTACSISSTPTSATAVRSAATNHTVVDGQFGGGLQRPAGSRAQRRLELADLRAVQDAQLVPCSATQSATVCRVRGVGGVECDGERVVGGEQLDVHQAPEFGAEVRPPP